MVLKKVNKICAVCADIHNGKLPRKAVPLYQRARCDVCEAIKIVTEPKWYGLTNKLTPILKADKIPKKPLKHCHKPKKVSWLCLPCALLLNGNRNRIHCATIIKTTCECCGKDANCAQPRFYELKTNSLKKG